MLAVKIILGSFMIICSLLIIAIVLLQQSRRSGIGAISGGVDSFFSKSKARDLDSKLSNLTKWFAIGFFVLAVVANIVAFL